MKDPEIFVDNPTSGQPDYYDLPDKVLGDDKQLCGQAVAQVLQIFENNVRTLVNAIHAGPAFVEPDALEQGAKDVAQLIENYRTAMQIRLEERFPSENTSKALH